MKKTAVYIASFLNQKNNPHAAPVFSPRGTIEKEKTMLTHKITLTNNDKTETAHIDAGPDKIMLLKPGQSVEIELNPAYGCSVRIAEAGDDLKPSEAA